MPKTSKTTKLTTPKEVAEETPNTLTECLDESKVKYKVKPIFDSTTEVPVINGFSGRLVYKSRKTGEVIVWENFGSEQYIELSELRNAKSSNKKFFINNWFLFDDPEVIQWLGVDQYYKNSLKLDEFDGFFEKTPDEIVEALNKMSKGQKKTIAFMARQLITDEKIDSRKVITALETGLGMELVEH